jgi:hypothetical protein
MYEAIGLSQNFLSVRLCLNDLHKDDEMKKALTLLRQYKGQLKKSPFERR